MASTSAICAMVVSISLSPLIGGIAADLSVNLGEASLALIGLPTLVMALSIGGFGFVIDRIGPFPVIAAGQGVMLASSLLLPIVGHGFEGVVAIRAVQGLATGALMASITPLIAAWFPIREVGRAMSFPEIGSSVGMMLGLNLAPALTKHLHSWRWGAASLAVFALGGLALTAPVAFAALGRRVKRDRAAEVGLASTQALLAGAPFWVGLAIMALAGWANMAFSDLTPGFLAVWAPVGAGLGAQGAGRIMSSVSIAGIAGAPLAGLLIDKVFRGDNRAVVLIGWVIAAVFYTAPVLTPLYRTGVGLGAALLIAGFANPFINVSLLSFAAKSYPHAAVGRVCGLWMSFSFLAGAVGVMAGALALRGTGTYIASEFITLGICVLGLFLALLLGKTAPSGDRLPASPPQSNPDWNKR